MSLIFSSVSYLIKDIGDAYGGLRLRIAIVDSRINDVSNHIAIVGDANGGLRLHINDVGHHTANVSDRIGSVNYVYARFRNYQGIGWRSRKKLPVGPLSGNVASHITVSAPSAGVFEALAPPISVLTQPGQRAFTKMFVPFNS